MPSVAYSLRRLFSAYSGPLVRVRETGGNTEQDFGYDANGDLDVAAIASFVGANDGMVVTWYDQIGGNHASALAGSAARQPRIAVAGVVTTKTTKPTIDWVYNGTAKGLVSDATLAGNDPIFYAVAAHDATPFGGAPRVVSLCSTKLGNDYDAATAIALIQARYFAPDLYQQQEFQWGQYNTQNLTVGQLYRFRGATLAAGPTLSLGHDNVAPSSSPSVGGPISLANSYVRVGCANDTDVGGSLVGKISTVIGWLGAAPSAGDEATMAAFLAAAYEVDG
jgi:hypothetical protein